MIAVHVAEHGLDDLGGEWMRHTPTV
jgi:hypothetical protein